MNKNELYKLCKETLVEKTYKLQQENQSLKEENERLKQDEKHLKKCGFANVIQLLLAYAGLQEENMLLQQENHLLKDRIEKSIEVIESYNLGKYDYSVPPGGITDLLEILKGDKE